MFRSTCISCRDLMSHILIVLSALPDATHDPSGKNWTQFTTLGRGYTTRKVIKTKNERKVSCRITGNLKEIEIQLLKKLICVI